MDIPHGYSGLNEVYGDPKMPGNVARPNPSWVARNIVSMPLPYPMYLAWDLDVKIEKISIHRLCVPDLQEILKEIHATCQSEVFRKYPEQKEDEDFVADKTAKVLRYFGLDLYGGGYNYRLKRGGKSLSTHSWGCAIDLDPVRNGMGDKTPEMPKFAVKAFKKRGWVWGGDWQGRGIDGMHFQRATGV